MSIMWYVILIATSLPFAISLYAQAESHLTEETNNAKNTQAQKDRAILQAAHDAAKNLSKAFNEMTKSMKAHWYGHGDLHCLVYIACRCRMYMLRCMISMQRIGIDKYTCAGTA